MSSSIFKTILTIGILIFIVGCVKEVDQTQEIELHEVVFHAGWDFETKTVLQKDDGIWWSPGDEISLFFGNGESGGKLTSINSEPSANADFVGHLQTSVA